MEASRSFSGRVMLKDVKQGMAVTMHLRVVESKVSEASNQTNFLSLTLTDGVENIKGIMFNFKEGHHHFPSAPLDVVRVEAVVDSFKDAPQLKISTIGPSSLPVEDFIKAAPYSAEKLRQFIGNCIASITDDVMKTIVSYCVDKAGENLWTHPAAKSVHHSYYSGLAYHIARMLLISDDLCKQRKFLSRDLLLSGVILHDLGKVSELKASLGMVEEYSKEGRLIGHISLVSGWIVEAALKLGYPLENETVILLQHLVLSHHNSGEWGSPVRPQIPEAVALHHIDNLDAKLQMVEDMIEGKEPGSWTDVNFYLDKTAMYIRKPN